MTANQSALSVPSLWLCQDVSNLPFVGTNPHLLLKRRTWAATSDKLILRPSRTFYTSTPSPTATAPGHSGVRGHGSPRPESRRRVGSTHAYTCEFKRNLTVRITGAACLLSNMGFQQDWKRKLDKCGAAASVHQIGIKISICRQCKLPDVQPRLDLEFFVIKPTTRVVKFQVSTVLFRHV